MSAAVIRAAEAGDATAIYSAWETLRTYYAGVDARIVPAPVVSGDFERDFLRRLERPDLASFVAVDSGALVGFITGGLESNQPDRLPPVHATVGHLFVDPGYRRRGVARQLFEALSLWAGAQAGVSHIEMPVLAGDAQAVPFWEAIGFTPFIQRLWAPLHT